MTLLASVLSLLAALCIYLASAKQTLRAAPLARPWRVIGVAVAIVGFVLWTRSISVPAAIFASLTCWMTGFVLPPYLGWYLRTRC